MYNSLSQRVGVLWWSNHPTMQPTQSEAPETKGKSQRDLPAHFGRQFLTEEKYLDNHPDSGRTDLSILSHRRIDWRRPKLQTALPEQKIFLVQDWMIHTTRCIISDILDFFSDAAWWIWWLNRQDWSPLVYTRTSVRSRSRYSEPSAMLAFIDHLVFNQNSFTTGYPLK